MKIRILRPFTGAIGDGEKPFVAGQEIAVPGELDRVTAKHFVNSGRAQWLKPLREKEDENGHQQIQD